MQDLKNNLVLLERALRSHASVLRKRLDNLTPEASDDYFCSLAYEALDAEELAGEIAIELQERRSKCRISSSE